MEGNELRIPCLCLLCVVSCCVMCCMFAVCCLLLRCRVSCTHVVRASVRVVCAWVGGACGGGGVFVMCVWEGGEVCYVCVGGRVGGREGHVMCAMLRVVCMLHVR